MERLSPPGSIHPLRVLLHIHALLFIIPSLRILISQSGQQLLAYSLSLFINNLPAGGTTRRLISTMGIVRKLTLCTGVLAGLGTGALGYLRTSTTIISPLPQDDPLWRSKSYAKYNTHHNAPMQDICVKRIPLDKIRPELLQHDGDLALEFCRGVWSGLGEMHGGGGGGGGGWRGSLSTCSTWLTCPRFRLPLPARVSRPQIPRACHGLSAMDGRPALTIDV